MASRATVLSLLLCAFSAAPASAQALASLPEPAPPPPVPSISEGSIFPRKNARILTLAIPAPRGPILDRNGEPLAQNRVAWQLSLQYKQFQTDDRDVIIRWGRERIDKVKGLLKSGFVNPTDEQLYAHYIDRRWLPLYLSSHLNAEEKRKIENSLPDGVILSPVYQRYYPEGDLAAHIVGATRSVGKLATGPINTNEPLWELSEGRFGLEAKYNNVLQGEPGILKFLFDENGRKLIDEQVARPRPGGAVVTTLDVHWQKQAEKALRSNARRGAFILIDVNTGEVLAMASLPSFNLNQFIPGISDKDYKALTEDPAAPLFARAFMSGFPPGSTFKPMVAMSALESGEITEDTEIDCPASITLGNHTFNNHNHRAAGSLDVRRALALSNNVFFYQVGQRLGAPAFMETARHFGFGETTGLPLDSENAGLVPTNEWMIVNQNRRFMDGDAFNLAIGQGVLLASPLQVAQAMAGIGNGGALPKLHLINQVQDTYGKVTYQATPERRNFLGVNSKNIGIVRKGMRDVVNSEYGTGRSAALSFTELCGKTGTAQWTGDRRLAWFAGFLPYDQPRYAFVAVYEGKPGERPSGGKNAAPIVKDFFEPLKDEFKEILEPPPKALEISDDPAPPKAKPVDDDSVDDAPPALPIDPEAAAAPAPAPRNNRRPRRATVVEEDDTPPAPVKRPPRAVETGPAITPVEGDGDEDGEGD